MKIGYKTVRNGTTYIKKIVDKNVINRLTTAKLLDLPFKDIDIDKDKRWNAKKINAELLQAIERGESIRDMSKRLERVTNMDKNAAIRNARTMATSFENLGRLDGMKAMKEDGTIVKKQWLATISTKKHKTRDWHKELSGQTAEIDEPFINHPPSGKKKVEEEIMYPGDPNASAANVYNCRCTLIFSVEGFEPTLPKGTVRVADTEIGKYKEIKSFVWDKNGENIVIDISESPLKYSDESLIKSSLYENVVNFENTKYLDANENVAIFDIKGKILRKEVGSGESVPISDYGLENNVLVVTHTHPRNAKNHEKMLGGTFSYEDINIFANHENMVVFRAAAKEGTYSIVKQAGFDGEKFKKYYFEAEEAINRKYQKIIEKKREDLLRQVSKGVSKQKAQEIYHNFWIKENNKFLVEKHNVLIEGAKKYKYKYILEKRVGI